MPHHNKKPDDLIWYVLNEQAKGTSIVQVHRDVNRIAEEEGRPDWTCNRSTVYDILRRYNVGTRSELEAQYKQLLKESAKLGRQMIRHMNGTVPREAMLGAISEFDSKWGES